MNRLNLNDFKAQASESQVQELESLTGGILGACHCGTCQMLADDANSPRPALSPLGKWIIDSLHNCADEE